MSERKPVMNPVLLRACAGDPEHSFAGAGKLITCQHDKKLLIGGVIAGNEPQSTDWRLHVGALLWVPATIYKWHEHRRNCGWSIEDLLRDGLDVERYWKPIT